MTMKPGGALPVARGGRDAPADDAAVSPGRLAELLGYNLRRAQVRVFQDFAQAMAEFALSPGQLGVLLLVAANPGLSQSALGVALGVDRSSVVPLIDRLEQRGLVRRAVRPRDRRAHALELGAEGETLLERLLPRLAEHERRIAGKLSAAERRQLIDLLRRVAES